MLELVVWRSRFPALCLQLVVRRRPMMFRGIRQFSAFLQNAMWIPFLDLM